MVEIYAVKIPKYMSDLEFNKLIQYVDIEKQKRINRFVNTEDAYRTLLADILTRSIICKKFGFKNQDIKFDFTEYGKPYLENIEDFFFNVSHSGEWIVTAIHNFEIGIDIEMIKSIDFNFVEQFLTKHEYFDLISHPQKNKRLEYFYDLWTLKESYIKAIGKGLYLPLNSFTIKKNSNNDIRFYSSYDANPWYFKQYKLDLGYKLSVCSKTQNFPEFLSIKDSKGLYQEIKKY